MTHSTTAASPCSAPPPGVPLRFTVLMLLSFLSAGAVGVLTWIAGRHPAEALLAALLVLPGSYGFFNKLISR